MMSKNTKGENNPMYGKVGAMKGKKHTEETRKKMSLAKQRRDKINKFIALGHPRIVKKPWGEENIIEYNKHYCMKEIKINKGHVTSLQYHNFKQETMVIISGKANFYYKAENFIDNNKMIDKRELNPGDKVTIFPKEIHRLEALEDLVLIETSSPEVWDVERVEDSYGREGTSEA